MTKARHFPVNIIQENNSANSTPLIGSFGLDNVGAPNKSKPLTMGESPKFTNNLPQTEVFRQVSALEYNKSVAELDMQRSTQFNDPQALQQKQNMMGTKSTKSQASSVNLSQIQPGDSGSLGADIAGAGSQLAMSTASIGIGASIAGGSTAGAALAASGPLIGVAAGMMVVSSVLASKARKKEQARLAAEQAERERKQNLINITNVEANAKQDAMTTGESRRQAAIQNLMSAFRPPVVNQR